MTLIPPSSRVPGVSGPGEAQDPMQAALGFQTWNFHPNCVSSSVAMVSQTLYAIFLPTQAGVTYTGLVFIQPTAGVGTTPTGFFVGLASNANLNSTGTMLAQSSNLNGSAALLANGHQQYPFNAPYVETVTGMRAALVFENGVFGTTPVQFSRSAAGGGFATSGQQPLASTAGTAITAFQANGSPLANSYSGAGSPICWWVALY